MLIPSVNIVAPHQIRLCRSAKLHSFSSNTQYLKALWYATSCMPLPVPIYAKAALLSIDCTAGSTIVRRAPVPSTDRTRVPSEEISGSSERTAAVDVTSALLA